MERGKKKTFYSRRNKATHGKRNNPDGGIAEGDCGVVDLCGCFSLCSVFGSRRRYHQESSHEENGYESSVSRSSITTPITDYSIFDSPKTRERQSPLKGCSVYDEISCGSADSSSESDLSPLKVSITFTGPGSKPGLNLSLDELFRNEKALIREDRNPIDTDDVEGIWKQRPESPGNYSFPDEDETALIEHQLDELSNQSSQLSFDADDFLEDDNELETYADHVDNDLDLAPINEETMEDLEIT